MKARVVDGETVLLDRAGCRVHQLNASASFVWSKLDGRASADDVVAAVVEEFEVERQAAAKEVHALLEQFRSLNLLDPNGSGGD